jgi:hypothetical protein
LINQVNQDYGSETFVSSGYGYYDDMVKAVAAALAAKDEERDSAQAEIKDLRAALAEARGDTYPQPKEGWQCFHCGEWFTTWKSARSHFGESPEALHKETAHLEIGAAGPNCECRVCAMRVEISDLRSRLAVAEGMRAKAEYLADHIDCYEYSCTDHEKFDWTDAQWIAQGEGKEG